MQFCHRYEGQHWDCAIKVTTVEVYILTAESSEKTSVSTTTYFTGHRHAALGLLPALSSDAPVTPPDPLGAIRAAVIRRTGSGLPLGGPQLRLDQATALAAHTIAAARAAGTAQRVGSLEPGKLADLAVLDTDPVAATPDQLDGIGVIQTWVGGTLRYQRPAASAATRRP